MAKTDTEYTSVSFRAELKKRMPGYDWTIHKSSPDDRYLIATGTQSSGFNRLSTLQVRVSDIGKPMRWYECQSSGFGLKGPWRGTYSGPTLAKALRGLQDQYKHQAALYRSLESDLEKGRQAPVETTEASHD